MSSSQRSSSSGSCETRISSFLRPSPQISGSLSGSVPSSVIENVQIVDVVALRHLAFLGIASVIETGVVFLPRHLRDARAARSYPASNLPVAVSITYNVLFSEPLAEVP